VEVRDCRIRVLRARQNENPETTPEERSAFLKLEDKITALRALSAETVLAEFLKSLPLDDSWYGRRDARPTTLRESFHEAFENI
jgi:hypothetical protein